MEARGFKPIASPADLKINNSDNGFDHVYEAVDENGETFLMVVDSKQLKNGSHKLGVTETKGMQLSKEWIEKTALQLPESSLARAKILAALDEGKVRTAVSGLDKSSGVFKVVSVTTEDFL